VRDRQSIDLNLARWTYTHSRVPPRGQPPGGSQNSLGRDRTLQSLVQAIRYTLRGTRTHYAPPVASREMHPKISNSVLGLPYPFPTSV
jgi:hypothetical protein